MKQQRPVESTEDFEACIAAIVDDETEQVARARPPDPLSMRKKRVTRTRIRACDENTIFLRFGAMAFSQEPEHVQQFRRNYINARWAQLNALTKEASDQNAETSAAMTEPPS